MKRLLKLSALLGVVGWASWMGLSRPALAYSPCTSLNGTFCSVPPGTKTNCTLDDGTTSTCTCSPSHTWRCLL